MSGEISIVLKKKTAASVAAGYPWVFVSDMEMNSSLELAEPGSSAQFCDARGKIIAKGYVNHKTKLAGRILSYNAKEKFDEAFFIRLFTQALKKRDAWCDVPYYRLVHSEGDGLSGLVIDRFGDVIVAQTTTAGMERLKPLWQNAVIHILQPKGIIFRDDTPARSREGLAQQVTCWGEIPVMPVPVKEHQVTYLADLFEGQKTGWFYDQRANRQLVATYVRDKTVLDLYSHSGGFGLACAVSGAAQVTMVDSSPLALNLSRQAAELNKVTNTCAWVEDDIFEMLPRWVDEKKQFDIVIADPPAFIKERKFKGSGLKGYEKLARMCSPLVTKGGYFFIASCSHHALLPEFKRSVETGIKHAGIVFKHVTTTGADQDHPIHPQLSENEYLKGLLYQIL